jgi:hypothetical protein
MIVLMSMDGQTVLRSGILQLSALTVVISASSMHEHMFATKSVSYCPHMADACCFAPSNIGVDILEGSVGGCGCAGGHCAV